jgi:hypothetical protein
MKKLIVCLGCLLVLFAGNINAQGKSGETGLGETAMQFFETLILKRSPQKALTFVSKNAIVGECILPERWSGKKLSRTQVTSIFRKAFDIAGLPRVTKLGDAITSERTDLMEGKVSLGEPFDSYFQVFEIKESSNPQDVAYVCKFDDRKWFRERVAKPDVRYLLTRLKSGEETSVILTTLWVREKTTWRILTFEISSDED